MVEIKENEKQTVIVFKKTHNTIVNSMRRIIIDEVPTFAIDEVEVVLNESPLYDETIAQRMGLIPLKTDYSSYNFKDTCKCGGIGCAMCEVKMSLKQDDDGYVYSGKIMSDDPQIVPVDQRIPITKLFNGKAIELNIKATLGKGKDHAKWSPAHAYLRENTAGDVELIIESFGQLGAKEIYNKAIDIIIEKIDDLEGQL